MYIIFDQQNKLYDPLDYCKGYPYIYKDQYPSVPVPGPYLILFLSVEGCPAYILLI